MAQPDPINLISTIGLTTPLIGFYDAPHTSPFEPLLEPVPGKRPCIFTFYKQWLRGKTLHFTRDNSVCGGADYWLCNNRTTSRENFVKFLVDDEGLKASHSLMNRWLNRNEPYNQEHTNLLIGPLKKSQYAYLKTITFYVNPVQLSPLMLGAQYNSTPSGHPSVIAPFGSGCMGLVASFKDLDIPQAIIGATDIAMRQYLPPDILAFTVTKPLFQQLCALDERSFLYKSFWKRLRKTRGSDVDGSKEQR